MMPPQHLQHNASFSHMGHPAAAASPPMPNGMFQPRHPTPQPAQMGSRPSSRNALRRTSSNLVPMPHPHVTPPPAANGFAYAPNPPIYNPQAIAPPHTSPQPPFQPMPAPQATASHPPMQTHPTYMADHQRRQSQQAHLQPPPPPPAAARSPPQPETHALRPPEPSPPQPKHLSSKSRSIFTPIDEGGSMLKHFFGAPESAGADGRVEASPEVKMASRTTSVTSAPKPMPQPARSQSMMSEFAAPTRSNTSGSKSGAARPKLNLQIPSEASDGESGTGSSPNRSSGVVGDKPASESHHTSGIVLPPPSPSASAVLSAGATGPPNPFARPPPPPPAVVTAGLNNNGSSSASSFGGDGHKIDTPASALPSRFLADNLLPSPNNFFSDWNFGRSGLDSAVLPSPLAFPTPANVTGPGFGRADEAAGDKRKGSASEDRDRDKLPEAKRLKAEVA